ncbi:cytosine permease [Escherichia coli]
MYYCRSQYSLPGADTWNVLDIVQRWDSLFASFFAVLVILMTNYLH